MASFKLKKINDLTRSANFVERPTWEDLSSRIIQLYKIESKEVSISYLDNDGDLVVIDSNEELEWFYKKYPSPPLKEYKFLVQDSTCLDPSITPSSSKLSHLSTYNAIKRPHSPDDTDGAKRLKTDVVVSSDHISAGLGSLWKDAWGRKGVTKLFRVCGVARDGTLPDVCTPGTCIMLDVPTTILKRSSISAILVRQEYIMALTFAVLIARGGRASHFKHHYKEDNTLEIHEPSLESSRALHPNLNPFSSTLSDLMYPGAVAIIGHPGIGKTLFLLYIIVCRMLVSLPSLYMEEPGSVYIIDSSGVKKINISMLTHDSITEKYWCLIDSNENLVTVPRAISSLGAFIVQSISPHVNRTQWSNKSSLPLNHYFMKEWDLPELIMARTIHASDQIPPSELEIKTFLDRFISSARQVFAYAANQRAYEDQLEYKLTELGRDKIPQIMDSARLLSFDNRVSHHLVLITPSEKSRSRHITDIPTRFLYEKIRKNSQMQALDAAFLLYESFEEVLQTTAAAGYMYKDFTQYLIPLGGRWPVIPMTKFPKQKRYHHWKTSGTEKTDIYLCIGRRGGPPFEFTTAPSDKLTFSKLTSTGFTKDEQLVLKDGFYYPHSKTQATFDAFVCSAQTREVLVLQATIRDWHSVLNAGLIWLKSLGVEKVYFAGVTPVGKGLDLPFDDREDLNSFVSMVYHLPMEPVRPKQ